MTEEEQLIQLYNVTNEYTEALKKLSEALKLEGVNILENLTPKTYKSFVFERGIYPDPNNMPKFLKANKDIIEELLPKMTVILLELQNTTNKLENYRKFVPFY